MNVLILHLLMSSTCFEHGGSSAGRRLYIQLRYGTVYVNQYKQSRKCPGLKRVEDTKNLKMQILILENVRFIGLYCIKYNFQHVFGGTECPR